MGAVRWLAVCLLAGLAGRAAAACSGVASVFGDAEIASKLAQMIPGDQYRVGRQDLPESRPPPLDGAAGWQFCDWSCMERESSVVKTGERGQSKGVYEIEATFKPIQGVNSTHMLWLFENLHRDAVYAVDGKTYPMYLIFHGVDHLHHGASPADNVGVGSTFTWCEIPLTGCKYNRLSATEPWACPPNRTGFVRGDPPTRWGTQFHTKVNMTITRFDQGGIEFVAREKNPFFGGADNTRTVVTTRHTWEDSPEGLRLKTQQWLGLMQPGSNTEFDSSLIAPITNLIIKDRYLDGAANIPYGNATAAAYLSVLHYLQEYGSLSRWLPQLWAGRTQR